MQPDQLCACESELEGREAQEGCAGMGRNVQVFPLSLPLGMGMLVIKENLTGEQGPLRGAFPHRYC